MFFLQHFIIDVKEALSGSGCLFKGIKIPRYYPVRNSHAPPQEGLIMPLVKVHVNLLLGKAENKENSIIPVLLQPEMRAKKSKISGSAKKSLAPQPYPSASLTRLNWFPHRAHQSSSAEKSTLTQPNQSTSLTRLNRFPHRVNQPS